MNILITGATGFIGRNLLKELKKHHSIHILTRTQTDKNSLYELPVFEFADNIDDLSIYLKNNEIEGVIHLASLYLAQHQSNQIKDLILSNIYLGVAVLEASKQADIKWFLNTGTIWQNYITDSNEYNPVNLYAATKQAFIDTARFYTETSKLRFCTLKLCDTYGTGDTRRKIFTLFKQIAGTNEKLSMSPGEQKLDILHIDDAVKGFKHLVDLLQTGNDIKKEYMLTSEKQYSLKELAHIYEHISGKHLNIEWGGRPYREREVMMPCLKLEKLPEWKAEISLEEGLAQYCSCNR